MKCNAMPEKGFKRKLTAILSGDAVGFSRLIDEDEGLRENNASTGVAPPILCEIT
jgi:hypothetical protein